MFNRSSITGLLISVFVFTLFSVFSAEAQVFSDLSSSLVDYSKSDIAPAVSFRKMSKFESDDLLKMSFENMPAFDNIPAYCRVRGMLDPEIAFEVNLPDLWNGRFYMIGNGGHAGQSLDDPMQVGQITQALRHGFAVAHTNAGHDSLKEPGASFVMSNPQKAIDYAYRAVHLTAVTAKSIINEYYGRPASYSYWNSCSNGGRQGLIEAQRFPEDFDGIVANAPWVDQTGFTIGAMWNQRALNLAPVTREKLSLLAERVMERCDEIDGLKDGLINDPRECDFDPLRDVPICMNDTDSPECLTYAQAEAIAKIYSGPVSNGENIFPGFMPGSEALMPDFFGGEPLSGWVHFIVSANPDQIPADFSLALETMRYLVHSPPKPDYDWKIFDFDRDIQMLEEWGRLANANNPDLSGFRERGGKLIMTYGWSDPVLQPMMGVNYYEQAVEKNGPDTNQFFRLFMIPGMSHCSGGFCPDQHDPMTALINWVEKGKAPETIEARQIQNGIILRTRPLCPYPKVSRYKGEGSINEAVNFECVTMP